MVLGMKAAAVCITNQGVGVVDESYYCKHEETDTRIFAHTASCTNCDTSHEYWHHYLVNVSLATSGKPWEALGRKAGWHCVYPLQYKLTGRLSQKGQFAGDQFTSLFTVYVLSVCDSVSCLFQCGKKRAANVATQNVDQLSAVTHGNVVE